MMSTDRDTKVWPEAHAKSLAYFYYALDTHLRKVLVNSKKTLNNIPELHQTQVV